MEAGTIEIRRIVPNIYSYDLGKSKLFYVDFLGMELVMDMQWILTFASKHNPTAQISVLQNEKNRELDNTPIFISIEMSDVDKMYEKAIKLEYAISYPIKDESWGVRRFFVMDPNGATINILAHQQGEV